MCLPEECKSEERRQILSGQNAAAFLKDCARDDLFSLAETKLENDSPKTNSIMMYQFGKTRNTHLFYSKDTAIALTYPNIIPLLL